MKNREDAVKAALSQSSNLPDALHTLIVHLVISRLDAVYATLDLDWDVVYARNRAILDAHDAEAY
jgi:hypothetical protein